MDSLQLRRSGPLGDAPRRLAPLLVFTMIGTVVGTRLLVALSPRAVTLLLGGFVLSYVLLDLARFSPRVPASWERRLAAPVGLAAGIMGGITNAPGTAIALYFVALGMAKQEFVRSIAFTFLVVKTVQKRIVPAHPPQTDWMACHSSALWIRSATQPAASQR